MYKSEVFAYFEAQGIRQAGIAEKLDISQPAVSKWPDIIPELQAIKLNRLTDGGLPYNPDLYRKSAA